jgi:energy-coupling factor transporter ATP-binding protein EcfA2
MRQRAAIASVLAINPSTLLMDEPFAALDALTRSIMQDFLLEVWEEERKTALPVTHDIDEAIYLADRTVVMTAHPGRVCEIIEVDLPRSRRYEMRSDERFTRARPCHGYRSCRGDQRGDRDCGLISYRVGSLSLTLFLRKAPRERDVARPRVIISRIPGEQAVKRARPAIERKVVWLPPERWVPPRAAKTPARKLSWSEALPQE